MEVRYLSGTVNNNKNTDKTNNLENNPQNYIVLQMNHSVDKKSEINLKEYEDGVDREVTDKFVGDVLDNIFFVNE